MNTVELCVIVIDMETKKCSEFGIIIEEDKKVYEIQDLLEKTDRPDLKKAMFFYNGVEDLEKQLELPVKEIFKNGDVVTVYLGAIPPPWQEERAAGNKKNIKKMCEMEIRMTLRTKFWRNETHISDERIYAIDFDNFDKKIELYWDTGRKNDVVNQKIFQGNRYKLDKGENILEFRIMNDGLYKVTVDGEVEVIDPIEEGLTKIHRDFLNDNHNYEFQNTGDIPLCVVSGRKRNWDVSPPLAAGAKQRITVKKNRMGYEFGLIPADNTNSGIQGYPAQMFDSKYIADVEAFNVWKAFNGPFGASAIMNGETFHLQSNRTKHYRDEDRINTKNMNVFEFINIFKSFKKKDPNAACLDLLSIQDK